ncbi:MAG: cell division protein FtsL [Firmicutes bacterium]|nr:cell division protein FtsL [Bacillota bacterium]
MKKTGKVIKTLRIEKLIYSLIIFVAVLIPIANVFTKAVLSETNIEVEKLENKISKQTNINDSLDMQINELASLDKIQGVANNLGLSYNNDNIKLIISD